ncbi:MAG: OmpA family protein [Alphaproteobacteria bacterium]|nr:OmpA family protein [Alphaproteobacteria bacterium]
MMLNKAIRLSLILSAVVAYASTANAQVTLDLDAILDNETIDKPAKATPKKLQLTKPKTLTLKKKSENKEQTLKVNSNTQTKTEDKPIAKKVKGKSPFETVSAPKKEDIEKTKPKSAPVPVVTIKSVEKIEPKKEITNTPSNTNNNVPSQKIDNSSTQPKEEIPPVVENKPVEAEISKHFIEQQQKEAEKVQVIEEEKQASQANESSSALTTDNSSKIVKNTTWSVFPVTQKMDYQERSDFLVKVVPQDSATYTATTKERYLYLVFSFEKNSADLTEEMLFEIENLSKLLNEDKTLSVLIYAYSGSTAPEYGREREMSLRRAIMVRYGLMQQGIKPLRIEIRSLADKGAGDATPNRADILLYHKKK